MDPIYLSDDFKEFLRLLNSNEVEYVIVGGYAVAHHGHPRTTGDLDVWIAQTEPNIARVVSALKAFGFDVPQLTPDLFRGRDRIVRMGSPPVRIELLTQVSGLSFADSYGRARPSDFDGVPVRVISLDDLRTNKRAAGRPKDLADLDALKDVIVDGGTDL